MAAYPLLQNNPFRILGCYGNATTTEINAAYSQMINRLESGEIAFTDLDFDHFLGGAVRTKDNIEEAYKLLLEPDKRRDFAMFSPWKGSDTDAHFLACLREGKVIDVTTEFKDRTPASFQNEVYAKLLNNDFPSACDMFWKTCFYFCEYNEDFRKVFNITEKGTNENPLVAEFIHALISNDFCNLPNWKATVTSQIKTSYKNSFLGAIDKVAAFNSNVFDDISSLYSSVYNESYGKMRILNCLLEDENERAITIDLVFSSLVDLCIRMMDNEDEFALLQKSFTYKHLLDDLYNEFPHTDVVRTMVDGTKAKLADIQNKAPDYQQGDHYKKIKPFLDSYKANPNRSLADAIELTKKISLDYIGIKYHTGMKGDFDRIFSEMYAKTLLKDIEPLLSDKADEKTLIDIKVLLMYLNNMTFGSSFKYGEYEHFNTSLQKLIDKKGIKHSVGKAHELYDDRLFEGDLNFMSYHLFTEDDYELFKQRFPFMADLGYKRLKKNQSEGKTRPGVRSFMDKLLGRYPIEDIIAIAKNKAKQAAKPAPVANKASANTTSRPGVSSPQPVTTPGTLSFATARVGDIYKHTIHYDEREGDITFFMSKEISCRIVSIDSDSITMKNIDEENTFKVFPALFREYKRL